MERRALQIAGWGLISSAKIPVINTKDESAAPLIKQRVARGVQLNTGYSDT